MLFRSTTTVAPSPDTDVEPAAENDEPAARPTRSSAPAPRAPRAERRRGFSPVIRADAPPARPTPPETEDEAVAQVEMVQRTEEEERRWSEGQAAAARAATRAARHASAVAGRPFGPNRRGLAAPAEANTEPPEAAAASEAPEQPADDSAQPARPPEDDGQNANAPPLDVPDEEVE